MAEGQSSGPSVDRQGAPVIDPSKNVDVLVETAVKRLDDLRSVELAGLRREMDLRADHAKELRLIETARLDAIRAVDVGAVQRAAEVQALQQQALAAQVVTTADAFRANLALALEPLQKDIRDLRDAQSRTVGGKDQGSDLRLNASAWIAAAGVLLILVFGVMTVLSR